MIKKKIAATTLVFFLVGAQSYAANNERFLDKDEIIGGITGSIGGIFDDIFNDIFGEIFTKLDDATMNVVSLCYKPNKTELGLDGDICSVLGSLEKELTVNVCDFAPPIPGFTKKQGKEFGLTGIKSLCNTKAKNLQSIATEAAISKTRNIIDEAADGKETKLANGMTAKEYSKKWSVQDVLKKGDKDNPMYSYILANKQEEMAMFKDFFATEEGGKAFNGGLANVKPGFINDIKIAATLDEYEQGVKEMAKITRDNYKSTSAYNVAASASNYIKDKNTGSGQERLKEAQNRGAKFLANKEKEIEAAQSVEIGQMLALSRKPGDYAIPTQEMVDLLREDLKPAAIAKIREQQRREAFITSSIAEKWERRKALASLMVDKEVILTMEFDREKAKEEIEKIASSAGNNSGIGGIGRGAVGEKDKINSIVKK